MPGGRITTTVYLPAGTVLKLIVGQRSAQSLYTASNNGGNGGTFVLINGTDTPIVVAGGSGRGQGANDATQYTNCDANINGAGL
jgi:hypothetical protein